MSQSSHAESQQPDKLQDISKRCIVRPSTTEDAERVIAVQNQTFHTQRTTADWHWNNEQNPYYSNLAVICELDGEIVGSYCSIGVKLNYLGVPVLACQPTNTIVVEQYRKQGIFTMMTDRLDLMYKDFKVQVLFGFPNDIALPINLGRLQLHNVAVVKNYTYKLRLEKKQSILSRALYSLYSNLHLSIKETMSGLWVAGTEFSITDKIPDDYESLWKQIRKIEVIALWKDPEYLRWRYEQNVQFKPSYFTLRVNGKLVGFAVSIIYDGAGTICELFSKDKSIGLAKFMVNKICRYYRNQGVDAVKFYGHDRGFFESAFCDFQRIPNQDLYFAVKALDGDEHFKTLLYQSINWSLSAGDFFF